MTPHPQSPEELCVENNGNRSSTITILHFNDIYNIEEQPKEPKAGAARFKTAMRSFQDRDPLIFFSGDALAPSIMSSFTKGEQMVTVMNDLNISCAVYGNHDFDHGLERTLDVRARSNFPWLLSNVLDNETNRPLGDGLETHIINHQGWKIGLVGLVEAEWLETLSNVDPENVTYTDYVDKGRELAQQLKEQGCDYIIALTHFRTPNDIRCAENAEEIDLFLGGHDHDYEIIKVKNNDKITLKSGTDFREFSVLTLTRDDSAVKVDIEKVVVDSRFEPDKELAAALYVFEEKINENMDKLLGSIAVDLDGRFSAIRTSETNVGNFVCDVMVACTNSDLALLNSGTLRSDRIHSAGKFKIRDLLTILPMMDPLIVIEITGEKIIEGLENGVSAYPKLDGRFPQVSGVQFQFDPNSPPGSRVIKDLVKIGDEFIDLQTKYRLVTKAYLANGKDGYTCFLGCPVLQDDEQCPMLNSAVQNHFEAVNMHEGKTERVSCHRQNLVLLSRRDSRIRPDDIPSDNNKNVDSDKRKKTGLEHWATLRTVRRTLSYMKLKKEHIEELENDACKLSPKIEGRIQIATEEILRKLRSEKAAILGPIVEES